MSIRSKAATVVFESVSKRYGDVTAVHDVSFRIEAGTLVTLLGPSGCGKTTTLRMVAGLEMASEGRIFIGDEDVTLLPATERDVTMVFQSYALFPHMSVADNVSYGLRVSGLTKTAAREQAEEGLGLVGLRGYGERFPSELSGGQQQRVAVARALVLEPQVVLFDEPLSNLDARLRRQVREEIREIQQSLGLTSLYVTHDQQEALAVSDRIIVMSNAVVAQEGSPRELYEAPASLFVAGFIGDANLLPATILKVNDGMARVRIGEVELDLPHRDLAVGDVSLAIRPEAVLLSQPETQTSSLQGLVDKASYIGSHIEYVLSTALGELFVVDARVERPFAVGASVAVDFADHGVTLVGN